DGLIVGATSGSVFCGVWDPDDDILTIQTPPTHCSGAVTGSLEDILRHELGRALGWTGSIIDNQGVSGASAHCVMHLNAGLNTTLCAHEIEGALAAYGLRDQPSNFWSKPFMTGSAGTIPADSVDDGDTIQLPSPGNWVIDGGGQVTGSYEWERSNTGIATVHPTTGVVTGVSPGGVTITAYPDPSSTYHYTKTF